MSGAVQHTSAERGLVERDGRGGVVDPELGLDARHAAHFIR
jgi:hypothetical protein